MEKKLVALKFGTSLDEDDYQTTKSVLSDNCTYIIGTEVINGPDAIAQSYESNMIEGRKKLDKLEWGRCTIQEIDSHNFYVHFTDYLTHKGMEYIHRCKQKLTVGPDKLIIKIEHVHDQAEQDKLDKFYKIVGLK